MDTAVEVSASRRSTPAGGLHFSADLVTGTTAVDLLPESLRAGAAHAYRATDASFFAERHLQANTASQTHIAIFTVGLIISGMFFSWSAGLVAGFGSYFLASLLVGLGYVTLTFCLAEMASALPFSGGGYGFARATMGKLPGMLVGLAESSEYILTTAVIMMSCAQLATQIFGTRVELEPIWMALLYFVAVGVHIKGGRTYWLITSAMTILAVLLLVLYWFTAFSLVNFSANAPIPLGDPDAVVASNAARLAADPNAEVDAVPASGYFLGGGSAFMSVLPLAIWWFLGVEAVPLTCEETKDAKKAVPKGMLYGMAFIGVSAFITLFVGASVPTDPAAGQPVVSAATFPMLAAIQTAFGVSDYTAPGLALLILPGLFVSAHTFIFAYGRQLYSMARSGFLPVVLSDTSASGTPWVAMLAGSMMGYFVCVVGRLAYLQDSAGYVFFQAVIYNWMLLVALVNYLTQLCSYVIFRLRYSMLTRAYHSPLGVPGAVCGIGVFALVLLGMLGWGAPKAVWVAVVCAGSYLLLGSVYYLVYARYHLRLSPEEQVALFVIYSVQFIRDKQERATNARKYQVQPHTAAAAHTHIDTKLTDAIQRQVETKQGDAHLHVHTGTARTTRNSLALPTRRSQGERDPPSRHTMVASFAQADEESTREPHAPVPGTIEDEDTTRHHTDGQVGPATTGTMHVPVPEMQLASPSATGDSEV